MRFFIGNLIRGEAAEYYKATCSELASRFGVEDVSAIVAPHVTVRSPFDKPDSTQVEEIIASCAESSPAMPLVLNGWNHFTTRTIFVDAPDTSAELKSFISEVQKKLQSVGLANREQDDTKHVHMSVARFLKPPQYEAVWNYLSALPAPKFDLHFDNLTIFVKERREDKAWKVHKTFPLVGKKK